MLRKCLYSPAEKSKRCIGKRATKICSYEFHTRISRSWKKNKITQNERLGWINAILCQKEVLVPFILQISRKLRVNFIFTFDFNSRVSIEEVNC